MARETVKPAFGLHAAGFLLAVLSILALSMLLFVPLVSALPVVNEVMAQGTEWIEVYNADSQEINLSEWKIADLQSTDDITCFNIANCSLLTSAQRFIIIDRDTEISSITSSQVTYFYVDDLALGNGLANTGDTVTLSNSNLSYSNSLAYSSSSVDKSWNRFPDGSSTLEQCSPSAGEENSCSGSAGTLPLESNLTIASAPDSAKFNRTIDVQISVYRGDTDKFSVRASVENELHEVSEETIFHADEKFKTYDTTLHIKLKSSCDTGYDEGAYSIIIEGLDKNVSRKINLERDDTDCDETEADSENVDYSIDYPESLEAGKDFSISINIDNNERNPYRIRLWSYIYSGSLCVSCFDNREENLKEIDIKGRNETNIVLMDSLPEETEEGDYNLMIKIQKNTNTVPKEYVYLVHVSSDSASEQDAESILNDSGLEEETESELSGSDAITGRAVYEFNAEQIKNKGLWILTLILTILLIYLIMQGIIITSQKKKEKMRQEV